MTSFGSVRSSRNANVRSSVYQSFLLDEKCSRAHNIEFSLSGQSQVSLRSLSSFFIGKMEPKILVLAKFYASKVFLF